LRRDGGQTGETARVPSNRLSQLIMTGHREAGRGRSIEDLHPPSRQGQDLLGNAAIIHVAEAAFAQVLDAGDQLFRLGTLARGMTPQTYEPGIESRRSLQ
jgi:hypothetical protein